MPKFNPDQVWDRSLSWNNHASLIKTKSIKKDNGHGIDRRGTVSVPGFMIEVHAAKYFMGGRQTYAFTQLSTVLGRTKRTVTFKGKCYSEKYCVTLAKRFANKLKVETDQ